MSLASIIQDSRYNPCPPGMSRSVWKAMEDQRLAKEDLEKETKPKKRTRGIKNRGTKVQKDITKYDRNLAPSIEEN